MKHKFPDHVIDLQPGDQAIITHQAGIAGDMAEKKVIVRAHREDKAADDVVVNARTGKTLTFHLPSEGDDYSSMAGAFGRTAGINAESPIDKELEAAAQELAGKLADRAEGIGGPALMEVNGKLWYARTPQVEEELRSRIAGLESSRERRVTIIKRLTCERDEARRLAKEAVRKTGFNGLINTITQQRGRISELIRVSKASADIQNAISESASKREKNLENALDLRRQDINSMMNERDVLRVQLKNSTAAIQFAAEQRQNIVCERDELQAQRDKLQARVQELEQDSKGAVLRVATHNFQANPQAKTSLCICGALKDSICHAECHPAVYEWRAREDWLASSLKMSDAREDGLRTSVNALQEQCNTLQAEVQRLNVSDAWTQRDLLYTSAMEYRTKLDRALEKLANCEVINWELQDGEVGIKSHWEENGTKKYHAWKAKCSKEIAGSLKAFYGGIYTDMPSFVPTHRHVKTQEFYMKLLDVMVEVMDGRSGSMRHVPGVLYCNKSGKVFARTADRFAARFDKLEPGSSV